MYNVDLLKCAIVDQAAKDYVSSLVLLKGKKVKDKDKILRAKDTKRSCEQFFKSSWFSYLVPSIDCEWFRDQLVHKADDEVKRRKAKAKSS